MLSVKECIDYCELNDEEISAIAAHKRIPEVLAAELGECLLKSDVGTWLIKRYISDDLDHAEHQGDPARMAELRRVLEDFSAKHPTYDLR